MHSADHLSGKENMLKPMYNFEEFNKLLEPMFAANEKKPTVIWCVENGPFHKYIKKLRKQRRKNGCK